MYILFYIFLYYFSFDEVSEKKKFLGFGFICFLVINILQQSKTFLHILIFQCNLFQSKKQ